jgi:ABC-type spermidine/putrescine transport system permease subunit I
VRRAGTLALLLPAMLLLAIAFALPLARLAGLSFSTPGEPLGAYAQLLGDEVYGRVFGNTLIIAVIVTALSLMIAYPVAMALTRLPQGWRTLLFGCILLPLWISVLVRTFSWMLLLERNGPLNRFLIWSRLTDTPLEVLFTPVAVVIGMVHVLLPYAVLPIYAALIRIDPALMRASDGLGASGATTFRRVLLPLSANGIMTAATFVFLLSLGFFITPALLGGARSMSLSMLIDSFVSEQLVWPLAAAASMILVAGCLAVIALAGRVVPIRNLVEAR